MQLQVTPKRVLIGAGLSLLLVLQCVGNVIGHKWSMLTGILFGILGIALAWTVALTARSQPQVPVRREFRKFVLVFLASVAFFWILFAVLDVFHVPWRQYWR